MCNLDCRLDVIHEHSMLQSIMEATVADVQAVRDRDAACDKYLHCILYYKGFQAVQCHRIAHWLWKQGRHVSHSLHCSFIPILCSVS